MKKLLFCFAIALLCSACSQNKVKTDVIETDTVYWSEDSLLQQQGSMSSLQIDSIKEGIKQDYHHEGLLE